MKGATGKIAPVPNRPNEAAAAVHGEPPSTHGCGLLEVASHTVAPAWTSIGAVGSARTRNVLRSWSPTARAARHVANSPKPRISVIRAGILVPVAPRRSTVAPISIPLSRSSRILNENQRSCAASSVRTGCPGRIASPSSATITFTTPSRGARRSSSGAGRRARGRPLPLRRPRRRQPLAPPWSDPSQPRHVSVRPQSAPRACR